MIKKSREKAKKVRSNTAKTSQKAAKKVNRASVKHKGKADRKAASSANIEDRLELPEIDLSKIEEINLPGPDLPDIEEIDFSKLEFPDIEELEIDIPEIVLEDFKIDQPKKKGRK